MCCVLQAGGAERVFPSSCSPTSKRLQLLQLKDSRTLQDEDGSSPATAHDLPLESLWAAGLDDGMGFPRRCSYANQRSANAVNANGAAGSSDTGWRERRACRTLGRCSTSRPDRYDNSPRDEIWTLSRELGSSRYDYSGWSRNCARFGARGSSTSGFGSSSTETRNGGSFSRNKSLQAIVTCQPRSQRHHRRNGYPSPDSPPPLPPPMVSTIATRNRPPQARRSFSTSLVAELALVTAARHESQRSLDSPEYLVSDIHGSSWES
ncbi:hypothetical protein QAD02_004218 [Eretmocerus hayati]|uniref:Uncharacterized protein n=1 Tax=Eretmocerus hayati TaxID=131215 RepID=A0ACC2NRU7_9HYME|nr:hypothetical protein QAD02_004218 [Eretmocerus hayati]